MAAGVGRRAGRAARSLSLPLPLPPPLSLSLARARRRAGRAALGLPDSLGQGALLGQGRAVKRSRTRAGSGDTSTAGS